MHSLPPVLTIAGSDNSAGAGIQADLKTMSALGVYGLTAVTCVVAEVPGHVSAIRGMEPEIVAEQVRLCFEAFPLKAVKTGMLHSAGILRTVVQSLRNAAAQFGPVPLVVDPVMVATSGARLLEPEALELYQSDLLPMASLITPNLDEAAVLVGEPICSRNAMCEAGRVLAGRYRTSVLMKGGHLKEDTAADLLVLENGREHWFEAPFVHGVSTHGTGCTYSAAIASELGLGRSLEEAVGRAKQFVSRAIAGHLRWPRASRETDALHHFAGTQPAR